MLAANLDLNRCHPSILDVRLSSSTVPASIAAWMLRRILRMRARASEDEASLSARERGREQSWRVNDEGY